jgi:hypothetical protein
MAFELPKKLEEQVELAAALREMSPDQFINESLSLCAKLSPAIWPTITEIAHKNRVSESLAVQNIIIQYLAWQIAWEEIFPDKDCPTPEFSRVKGGVATGERLLNDLVKYYKSRVKIRRSRIGKAVGPGGATIKIKGKSKAKSA